MMSVENQVRNLAATVDDVSVNMRIFSLSMRSLYAEKALGESSDTTTKMNKIRDDTREDALLYVKGILPVSTELVRILKEFFEYYEKLSFEEWKENLSAIFEEVKGYRQCCEEIINLHEGIMISLNKRADEARVLIDELGNLTQELEREKAKLEKSASIKTMFAIWLLFVPQVSLLATPLLCVGADLDRVKAVADGAQCKINNAAVYVVTNTMIPALEAFINGLEGIAGFFSAVEQEIATFQSKGEKALENPLNLHYIMMEKKSKEIKQSCKQFFAMIPGVRADILCIPHSGSNQNYVDKWLKNQQEEIKRKYAQNITGQLKRLLTYLSTTEGEKLMIKGKD